MLLSVFRVVVSFRALEVTKKNKTLFRVDSQLTAVPCYYLSFSSCTSQIVVGDIKSLNCPLKKVWQVHTQKKKNSFDNVFSHFIGSNKKYNYDVFSKSGALILLIAFFGVPFQINFFPSVPLS